jgi:hypothetical protein
MYTLPRRTCAGAGRLGCFLLLVTIALIWGGGQGVYTALSNRQPTAMTYDEYVQKKPRASWLELKDCYLSLPEATVRKSKVGGKIKEAFIPIVAAPGQKGKKVQVLVATQEEGTLNLLNQVNQATDEHAAAKLVFSNLDKLFPNRTVRGLVRFGVDMKDRDRRKLAEVNENLASDFVVIDEGKEPRLGGSAVALVIGLALGAWALLGGRKSPEPPQAQPPTLPTPPAPPPLPHN